MKLALIIAWLRSFNPWQSHEIPRPLSVRYALLAQKNDPTLFKGIGHHRTQEAKRIIAEPTEREKKEFGL